jgi:hypothetical protein
MQQAKPRTSLPVRDPRADALRERYRATFGGPELPVALEAIAEDLLGLRVEEGELEVSGMLLPIERRILLNATESPQRRRFTLAHELGHWVCQCLEGRTAPIYCRAQDVDAGTDRLLEREANVFAADLVMPEAPLRTEFLHGATGPEACGQIFDVSTEAMSWRLYNFGLVDRRPEGRQ